MSFPAYPDYRDSDIAWLGEVPSHWLVVPLKRRFSVTLGKMLQSDAKTDDDVERPYLRAANIKWGQIDTDDVKTMWFSPHEANALELRAGDLIVSEGGDVGRSAIWRNDVADCHFQNSVNRVRSTTDSRTDFLFYWMVTIKAKGYVDVLCNKSTIAHFTAEKVAAVPLPVPTPDEQAAIAAFLDRETAKIDELVAEQERLIALLREKRQAVISHAVTKGLNPAAPMKDSGIEWLGEIPAHWLVQPVKYCAQIGNGSTPNKEDLRYWRDGTFPWLNSSVVNLDVVDSSDNYVTETALVECHLPIVKPPAILMAITGQGKTRGMVAPLTIEATISQHVAYIKPDEAKLNPLFALRWFESLYSRIRADSEGAGSTKGAITCDQIARMLFALPPLVEQARIEGHLKEVVGKFDRLCAEAEGVISLLQERRAALISAAVTGKIDVRAQASQNNVVSIDSARPSILPSLRAVVGAYAIRELGPMGRMVVMKAGYLAEGHAGFDDLNGRYERYAAGPYDQSLISAMERGAGEISAIVTNEPQDEGQPVTYDVSKGCQPPSDALSALVGKDRAQRFLALLSLLKGIGRDGVEAAATLYAVWNDLLAAGKAVDDDAICNGVLNDWHPEKAKKFKRADLDHWLDWMRRNSLVPDGSAPLTDNQGKLFA
ncbi:MAG: restriction endonuclease subunit S [Sphingobium sp.]